LSRLRLRILEQLAQEVFNLPLVSPKYMIAVRLKPESKDQEEIFRELDPNLRILGLELLMKQRNEPIMPL